MHCRIFQEIASLF